MLPSDHVLQALTRDASQSDDPHRTQYIALGSEALDAVAGWLSTHREGKTDIVVSDANTSHHSVCSASSSRPDGARARSSSSQPTGRRMCAAMTRRSRRFRPSSRPPRTSTRSQSAQGPLTTSLRQRHTLSINYHGADSASMNGYTSSISAVLSEGVKRTRPTHQPVAVFADVDVVRSAPPIMNQAGFGDLLSKPFSQSDWLLSHLLRGVPYSDEAARLLDGPWRDMLERADGMGTGDTLAINSLLETLLISGFSMAVAGTSAPASGAEHLISHYWDMEQHCHHEPVLALHGTQVGIGTLVSAFTLNRLLELPQERLTEAANLERSWSAERLKPLHPKLTPPILSEMAIQLNKKTLDAASLRREIETLAAQWPEIKEQLSAIVLPEEMMKKALGRGLSATGQ